MFAPLKEYILWASSPTTQIFFEWFARILAISKCDLVDDELKEEEPVESDYQNLN